jgi:hypothetical protein
MSDDSPRVSVHADDDLFYITDRQLDALDCMQWNPGAYMLRIVEQMSFLPQGGQKWERQVQLRLPAAHRSDSSSDDPDGLFIVSLGMFRRRRFADFTVTNDDSSRCHLLTRRQHGHCLAMCILRQFLSKTEWEHDADNAATALKDLHNYLASMITTMTQDATRTPEGAQKLLKNLFVALGIDDPKRKKRATELLKAGCESMAAQTQYLCWVTARPGATLHLVATYTQADSPRVKPEQDSVTASSTPSRAQRLRLWWRNGRTKRYVKYNVFPMRYTFDAPAFMHCGSYYFTITPPIETKITLLDWGTGRRFRSSSEKDADWGDQRSIRTHSEEATDEVDCSSFAYHFHNRRAVSLERGAVPKSTDRRVTERRGSDRRSSDRGFPDRRSLERRSSIRRKHDAASGTRIHAFLRMDPIDNAKLIAAGGLSLCLAVLAQSGALLSGGPGGSGQWLLLAPAALVLFVGQQRRHHYAHFTRPFRLAVWLYVGLAMLFAGSVVFNVTVTPLSLEDSVAISRIVSGLFAIASSLMVFAFFWSGRHFDRVAQKRCKRVVERVHWFGTPAKFETWRKYPFEVWIRRQRWDKWQQPLTEQEIRPNLRNSHPSDKIYSAIARHSIDRALVGGLIVAVLTAVAMVHWGWGAYQACAILKQQAGQVATERGKLLGVGKCKGDRWQTGPGAAASPTRFTPHHLVTSLHPHQHILPRVGRHRGGLALPLR